MVELERRDALVADALESVRGQAERAGTIRSRAAEVRDTLERIPAELDELKRRRGEAETTETAARSELERAEERVASLETSRRRRDDELDRARSEATTARDALADARAQLERLDTAEAQLHLEQTELEAEADRLVRDAMDVARGLQAVEQIAEGARRAPGGTLDELEEWGAQVRSALFVVRGTLETERERIVVEANALGSAVLGETLGGSSVAVIRRRLEQALGG